MPQLEKIFHVQLAADLRNDFCRIAKELVGKWIIQSGNKRFEFMEIEFLLSTNDDQHDDPFISCNPVQRKMSSWFLNSSGVDITFGNEFYFASIFIRSIRDVDSKELISGPWRVFETLFQDGGDLRESNFNARIVRSDSPFVPDLIGVPRVHLPVERDSKDLDRRLKHIFKPYRFIRKDIEDYPEKYLAGLYLEKVMGQKPEQRQDSKIYMKYQAVYEKGKKLSALDNVFNESSRMLRMAMLMGFLDEKLRLEVQSLGVCSNANQEQIQA